MVLCCGCTVWVRICLYFFLCILFSVFVVFFFQAEDGIRDLVRSRGLGDVYKRQVETWQSRKIALPHPEREPVDPCDAALALDAH